MWTRVVGKLLALFGLYAIILAGMAMRFSGQKNSSSFNLSMAELGFVTAAFIVTGVWLVTRRPKQPLE